MRSDETGHDLGLALTGTRTRLAAAALVALAVATAAGVLWVVPWRSSPAPMPAARPAAAQEPADSRAAERFAVGTVKLLVENRYATAWSSLHPAHRRAVGSRERYVRCERMTRIPIATTSINARRVRDVTTRVAGLGRVATKEVWLRIVFKANDGSGTKVTVTHPVHVLRVDGRWRWVLTNESYTNYASGTCGIAPPPAPTPALEA